jgi:hypothetical protein
MGRSAEMWQDAQEAAEQQEDTLAKELWQLGCAMNAARVEEIEADMPAHKRGGYVERFYEIADMQRKARRENGV